MQGITASNQQLHTPRGCHGGQTESVLHNFCYTAKPTDNCPDPPTLWGVPIRYISLCVLVIQNSALVLTMRYSRILPGPTYLSSTAVMLSELLKTTISVAIFLYTRYNTAPEQDTPLLSPTTESSSSSRPGLRQLFDEVFGPGSGIAKMLIPAVLYTLQNNLQFVAASHLDAACFQVSYQCKILTTAVFAVALLHQRISPLKWFSLLILTLGVGIVQLPSSSHPSSQGNQVVGFAAVAAACLLSGLAGVYFEKILKSHSASLWLRNIQLGSASIVIAGVGAFVWDYKMISSLGFFYGYNSVVVATILIQAAGGLIVAVVVTYADNILKGFATSLSIILSTVASVWIFNLKIQALFLVGASLVLFATYIYALPDKPRQVHFLDEEKILANEKYADRIEGQQDGKSPQKSG